MKPIRILIADDSELIHDRLKNSLSEIESVSSIDQAYTTTETLEKIHETPPDVVILDISMPSTSGLEVLNEIKRDYPEIKVIIFTNYPIDQFKKTANQYDADYFFDKDEGFIKIPELLKRFTMENEFINHLIEYVSESIVITNPSDLQAMGTILDKIEEITNWAKDNSEPLLEEASVKMSQLVKDIILEDVSDIEATMEIIGETLSAFQQVVRDNKSPQDVKFPEGLGLATGKSPVESESGQIVTEGLYHPHGLPDHIDPEVFADFLANQDSVLDDIEGCILALEQPDGEEKIDDLKRILHTLKGEAGLIGLLDVEKLCHQTEDFIDASNGGKLVDPLLAVKDWLRSAFDRYLCKTDTLSPVQTVLDILKTSELPATESEPVNPETDAVSNEPESASIEEESRSIPDSSAESKPETQPGSEPFTGDVDLVTDFISEANEHLEEADSLLLSLENDPSESSALDGIFRAFHTLKGVAGFLDLKEIGELAHEAENLLDQARKGALSLTGPAMDITFESVDTLKRMIHALETAVSAGFAPGPEPGLDNLIKRLSAIREGQEPPAVENKPAPEAEKPAEKKEKQTTKPSKLPEQSLSKNPSTSGKRKKVVKIKETLKVDAQRLDLLIDTIGELVIAESMISQSKELKSNASPELIKHINQLDKITRELQNLGTSLRMVTVRQTFQKMARLVRDLSKKSGKQVDFVMTGEDTEVDKTVVDKIGDPLVHMIRNAVDHGIEDNEQDRLAAGKPAKGRIELRAFHKGGNIYIEVEDDGQGLNTDVILAKAKERGLVKEGEVLSEREIWNLVLEPGFSTAKKVTEISGRGVGMDVVKRNIEELRGKVEISSIPGKGSVFTIRLPLTLAIIEGMVVRVGTDKYIIPTLSVNESLRPEPEAVSTVMGQGEILSFHDELVPIIRLDGLFGINGAEQDPSKAILVVFEAEGQKAALMVDELLGQQQVVIKSLGETMQDIPGLSGCTIMADGHVGIILDVSGLVKSASGNFSTGYNQAV